MKSNDKIDFSKPDCFAYPKEGNTECYCLTKCFCKTEKCNFYKPKDKVSISEIERAIRKYSGTCNPKKDIE